MITLFHPLKGWYGAGEDIQTSGCAVQLTLFFGHPEATHQLLQGERLVVADVAVLHKLLHALLWLGFLAQEAFERLDLLLAYVPAGVFVQLTEIPMNHPFLQGVAGVGLGHPKWQIPVQFIITPTSCHPKGYFHALLLNDWILSSIISTNNRKMTKSTSECHTFRRTLDLWQRAPCLSTARQEHLSGTLFSLPRDSLEYKAQTPEWACESIQFTWKQVYVYMSAITEKLSHSQQRYNSVECCRHRWPNKCLGRDVM